VFLPQHLLIPSGLCVGVGTCAQHRNSSRPGFKRTSTRWNFFGGVPTLAVPDNTKTAVTRACRYDPDLNPTYQFLSSAIRIAIDPPYGFTTP
jgi:hypothetical protein